MWRTVFCGILVLGAAARVPGAEPIEDRSFKIFIGSGFAPLGGGGGAFVTYFDGKDLYRPSTTVDLASSLEVPIGFVYSTPRLDVTADLSFQFEDLDRIGIEIGVAFPVGAGLERRFERPLAPRRRRVDVG